MCSNSVDALFAKFSLFLKKIKRGIKPGGTSFIVGKMSYFYPPGSKSEALQLGVHLILLYFFSRSDQFIKDFSCKFNGDFNLLVNLFFFIKLKFISFFIYRYLTVSLWGPVLTLRRGALRRVWRVGQVGRVDGRWPKVSFNFSHFKIYQTLNTCIQKYKYKSCPHKFLLSFKF